MTTDTRYTNAATGDEWVRADAVQAAERAAWDAAIEAAEKAMRDECTAPDGTYDMRIEGEIARAEAATVEVASQAILALKKGQTDDR